MTAELQSVQAKQKIADALNRWIPGKGATQHDFKIDDFVDVHDDGQNRWIGPYKFLSYDPRSSARCFVLSGNRALLRNVIHVRPHIFDISELDSLSLYCSQLLWMGDVDDIYMTVIKSDDPQLGSDDWDKADRAEFDGLIWRGVIQAIKAGDIPAGAVYVPSKIVRVIKSDERKKTRWV